MEYGDFQGVNELDDQDDWSVGQIGGNNSAIIQFLRTLSPGIRVELQYDCQPPASGTFQGIANGNVILTNYNGFSGLVRIAPSRINAVAPFSSGHCKGAY
ncbi:hypothetical protein ACFSO7_13120 [Bacillus sp. CGMCC 1.16607]|uniref:hypothetical protein n=1 Tax=Bacillus sp. CGMCC 1.16607 TaxID=3351842 RepID=UPI0036268B03